MVTSWISSESCEAAAQLGWFIGAATGTFADIIILILVATAPKLGPRRPLGPSRRGALWKLLYGLLSVPAVVWILGGLYSGRRLILCYATTLSIASALTMGVVLLLVMLTAANQIGARSVR
jgi:hypothetical protein